MRSRRRRRLPILRCVKPRLSQTVWILGLALLPILAAGAWALIALGQHPDNENDQVAARSLVRAAPAVELALAREGEELERIAVLVTKNPKFFAILNLPHRERAQGDFKNALENVLRDFQRDADTPIFEVMDETGALLARALQPASGTADLSNAPFVRAAVYGRTGQGYVIEKDRVFRVATFPVIAGGPIIGILCLGRSLDTEMAERLKASLGREGCDVAFTVNDEISATTLTPSPLRKLLAQRVSERSLAASRRGKNAKSGERPAEAEFDAIAIPGERFVVIKRTLQGPSVGGELGYVLTLPLTSAGSPVAAIQRELLYAGGAGLLLAIAAGTFLALDVRRRRRAAAEEHEAEIRRLTEIDRMRNSFIASASAEVLEPTAAIRTVIELIEEGALGEMSGPQEEGMLSIRGSTEALTRVGNDLANLSLLNREEFPLSLDAADLGNLVEHAAVVVVPIAAVRKQSVLISVEPKLIHPQVDAGHLSRAIVNLALNAVRFSPDGGRIEMGAKRNHEGISIHVSDSGAEVPEVAQGIVAGSDSERSGLGLAVAIGIVEAHGGTIRSWSQGSGNVFTIELPFPEEELKPLPTEEELLMAS
jgi:signal transduction histidine kinase